MKSPGRRIMRGGVWAGPVTRRTAFCLAFIWLFSGALPAQWVSCGNGATGNTNCETSGNLGIGTTTPGNLLAVNGVIGAGGTYNNVLSYFFDGTPANGVKIQTSLPYQDAVEMPTVILEGFNYGGVQTIGLTISWYIYGGNFYNPTASSFGGYAPQIQLSNENGKVVIFINDRPYYSRFSVRAYALGMSEIPAWFNGWTAVDAALTGTNTVTVPYSNSFVSANFSGLANFSGFVGIGTAAPTSPLHITAATPHTIPTVNITNNPGNPGCDGCLNKALQVSCNSSGG